MERERRLLLIFPHPDDEAFGVAGTVALYAARGTPITYLCGTLGELGRNMGRPFFANRESLPAVREQELREACRAMGITDLRMMGLHDKTVEFHDPEELADRILAVVEEVQPSLVITHYPGYSVHPDHDALSAAAIRALSRLPAERRPRVLCHAPPTGRAREVLGEPDVIIDISSVAEVKMAALRAHRSQTEGIFADWERRAAAGDPLAETWWERIRKVEKLYTYKF
ncbi:MAG: bacillithiol biosynthesis deacetylase BshB2 [Bacillota bacterium]